MQSAYRSLRNYLRSRWLGSVLTLQPLDQLTPVIDEPGTWCASGNDPKFECAGGGFPLKAGWYGFSIELQDTDGDRLEPFTLYVMAPGQAMTLRAETPARVMLLGGEAFPTQRHVFWNFVSSSRDRINQAKEDWKARRFPLVPGDEEEFIPLPEVPLTVTYP